MDCQAVEQRIQAMVVYATKAHYRLQNGDNTGIEEHLRLIENCIEAIREQMNNYKPVEPKPLELEYHE